MSNRKVIPRNIEQYAGLFRVFDLLIIQLSLLFAIWSYDAIYDFEYLIAALLGSLIFILVAESSALYEPKQSISLNNFYFNVLLSWGVAIFSILALLFFFRISVNFSRVVLAIWFSTSAVMLVSWRVLLDMVLARMRKNGIGIESVAIIGLTPSAMKIIDQITQNPEIGYSLKAVYDDRAPDRIDQKYSAWLKGNVADALTAAQANEFNLILIALPLKEESRILDLLHRFGDTTVDINIVPDLFVYSLANATLSSIGNVQTLNVLGSPISGVKGILKRFEDLIISIAMLLLLAIPMMIIAIVIKLTSIGPVFFKQYRYGLDGREIKVLKFRSMTVQETSGDIKQATKDDARVTPFGKLLRRTSLDELPQFINVLRGEMSIVGPRPHAVAHNEEYRKRIDYYMLRHKVKPGITGLAQVSGWRGETDTLEKMQYRVDHDLEYIRNWSLWMDFKIIIMTLPSLFSGKNAY